MSELTKSQAMEALSERAYESLRLKIQAAVATAGKALQGLSVEDLEERVKDHVLGTNANGWVNPYPADDPRRLLLEYQFASWHDPARFIAELWSRQTGKDFTLEGVATEDSLKTPRNEWMIAAPSERQALDSLDKAKEWAAAFELAIADYSESREGTSETLLKSAEVRFSNGSRIRSVPGKPDTVRGRSTNVGLTEFDFFENPDATWRAILPSVTNPLRGGQKKVRIVTTPNGSGSAMHGIMTKPDGKKMKWSRRKVTIMHAVLMGLPVDIEELREAFGDPEGWAQEFLCEFLDTASVLLPYELIAAIENPLATATAPQGYWEIIKGGLPVDLGIDFGRKKDLTVCWALEDIGGFGMTREVLELAKMPTHKQLEILRPRLKRARRACFDYTGPGIGLGDLLVSEFGEWNPEQHKYGKVELCTFTQQLKCEIFPGLRARADQRMLGIPVSREIREDLHSVSRIVTPAGNVTYRAPHTEDGHADRCTGLALAVRARPTISGIVVGSGVVVNPSKRGGRGMNRNVGGML